MDDLFIDSDNALGAPSGDVDDAYAITALLRSDARITAIGSCDGNTTAHRASGCNSALAAFLRSDVPVLDSQEAQRMLPTFEGRVAALGPLTNVVHATRASEIVIVGGNLSSPGRWPPLWPHEFNLTKDRHAAWRVFHSDVPLTIFPLDVARRLWVTREMLEQIPGPIGELLRRGTERWLRRLRRLRWTSKFPIFDLTAALYLLGTEGVALEEMTAEMRANTHIRFGQGRRVVRVCRTLDRDVLWSRFLALL